MDTILIVEDNREDAEALDQILRRVGVRNPIRWTHSALDAIAYVRASGIYSDADEYPPARIILLDLKMPGMDGFDLLEWLRINQRLDDFAVFVITGLEDIGAIRRAYLAGAKSFIQKPCTTTDLDNLIRSFPAYWERAKSDDALTHWRSKSPARKFQSR